MNIRDGQIEGAKLCRQESFGNYIVDFVSFAERIILEIDGGQHNSEEVLEKDRLRTQWLENAGYRVIRFWNSDVLENMEGAVFKIQEAVKERKHPHLASPVKGEGRGKGSRREREDLSLEGRKNGKKDDATA